MNETLYVKNGNLVEKRKKRVMLCGNSAFGKSILWTLNKNRISSSNVKKRGVWEKVFWVDGKQIELRFYRRLCSTDRPGNAKVMSKLNPDGFLMLLTPDFTKKDYPLFGIYSQKKFTVFPGN